MVLVILPNAIEYSGITNRNNHLACVRGNWEWWVRWPPTPLNKFQVHWYSEIINERRKLDDADLMGWITEWDSMVDLDAFTLTHGWIEKLPDQRESEPSETYLEPHHSPLRDECFSVWSYKDISCFGWSYPSTRFL